MTYLLYNHINMMHELIKFKKKWFSCCVKGRYYLCLPSTEFSCSFKLNQMSTAHVYLLHSVTGWISYSLFTSFPSQYFIVCPSRYGTCLLVRFLAVPMLLISSFLPLDAVLVFA